MNEKERELRGHLTAMANIRQHFVDSGALKMPGARYTSMEQLVLDLGRLMPVAAEPYEATGAPKMCYQTAGRYAIDHADDETVIYVEGFACGLACFPVHHAWLLVDGEVFDPTWGHNPDFAYIGVPISVAYLCVSTSEHGVWGVMDTGMDMPILRADPADYLVAPS